MTANMDLSIKEEYIQLYTAVSQWVNLSNQQWLLFAAIFKLRQVEARQFPNQKRDD